LPGSRQGRIRKGVYSIHSIEYFEWARWMGRNGRIAAETAFRWEAVDKVAAVYCA
jgi:hypothetical protein